MGGLSKKLRSWPGIKQKRLSLAGQHRNYNCAVLTMLVCLLFVCCLGAGVTLWCQPWHERSQTQKTEVTKPLHREPLPTKPKPIVHDEARKPAKKRATRNPNLRSTIVH